MAALDMYVEREQWEKCLETAAKQVAVGFLAPETHTMFLLYPKAPGTLAACFFCIKAPKKLATDL